MHITHTPPWLVLEFERPLRSLSWCLNHPGFQTASRVAWRQVRSEDLTAQMDAQAWFIAQLEQHNLTDALGFLTSRRLDALVVHSAQADDVEATCAATVGLSNAERVGHRRRVPTPTVGTINLVVTVDTPLADAALVESLTIAAQARTAAVMEHGPPTPHGPATGTGTDCIVLAAPSGHAIYAGLHTAVGEAVGRAVYNAVAAGVREWMAEP